MSTEKNHNESVLTAIRGTRPAARRLAATSAEIRNDALRRIRQGLQDRAAEIAAENQLDLEQAMQEGLAAPLLKRLRLDEAKLGELSRGLKELADTPDPLGQIRRRTLLDDGLVLIQRTCPIGVIGVIFESRPDALVQISSLGLKSGNALVLKGGSEALRTNRVLAKLIIEAGQAAGLPEGWLVLLESRMDVRSLLTCEDEVDLIIPRGSNAFVRQIMDATRIPVLGHADGVCHLYLDQTADPDMAIRVAVDSKTQNASACNAVETILVHRSRRENLVPELAAALRSRGVEIFAGAELAKQLGAPVVDEWHTEYLDYKVSLKLVDSLSEAIAHINEHGSHHTDAIITADPAAARQFQEEVDSAAVFWNCSTYFCDGYRFGLGAEVGISTGKIHARGPVGLDGLTTTQWRLRGEGHIVAPYRDGQRAFLHRRLALESDEQYE